MLFFYYTGYVIFVYLTAMLTFYLSLHFQNGKADIVTKYKIPVLP
jgi:hypothetical protein